MEIREVTKSQKDKFNKLALHPVQSWEWGNFRESTGNKVLRLGVYDPTTGSGQAKLTQAFLMTVHKLPGTHFSIAMCAKSSAPSSEVLKKLLEFVKLHKIIFIRFEPNIPTTDKNATKILKAFRDSGAKKGRPFFNKSTFVINLEKSEEELLAAMHPKTRYNIRVASRHAVEVIEDNSPKAFEKYLDLMDETTRRQKYFAHTERYHKLMWEVFHKSGIAHLLNAKYKGQILITWIVFSWHDTLYYPYGASSSEHREVMAAYSQMWNAILFGKKLDLRKFDLWGRDEGKGFTRFKEGFGPQTIEYLGTFDVPVDKNMHRLYRLLEEARWVFLKAKARFVPTSTFR